MVVPKKCSSGKILRKKFTVKRKDGSTYTVKAKCVPDRGQKGKGPNVLPKLEKGVMGAFGYAIKRPQAVRRSAIRAAIKAKGALPTLRHLVVLRTLFKPHPTKPNSKEYHKRLNDDVEFIRRNFFGKKRSKRTRAKNKGSFARIFDQAKPVGVLTFKPETNYHGMHVLSYVPVLPPHVRPGRVKK